MVTAADVDTAECRAIIEHAGHLPAPEEQALLDEVDRLGAENARLAAEVGRLRGAVSAARLALAALVVEVSPWSTFVPRPLFDWASEQVRGSSEPAAVLVRRAVEAMGRAAG